MCFNTIHSIYGNNQYYFVLGIPSLDTGNKQLKLNITKKEEHTLFN